MMKHNCTILFASMLCLTFTLFADSPHRLRVSSAPSIVPTYHLVDLGDSGLDPANLTKIKDGASLAPCINNCGEICGNRVTGGFISRPDSSLYHPPMIGGKFVFHSINTHGDVLASIRRGNGNVDWFIWMTHHGADGTRIPIDTKEVQGEHLQLLKINDGRWIAGEASPAGIDLPLVWYPDQGMYRVGHSKGMNVHGKVKDINKNGLVVGKSHKNLENFPYIWNGEHIWDLFKLRNQFNPPSDGKVVFEDLVITNDGYVYGTYWINTKFLEKDAHVPENIRAFVWDIFNNTVETFNWNGMRIAAMNKFHRAVGSANGKAVYAEKNFAPSDLAHSISVYELEGWELLEATDINDIGQIVGYGRKDGKIHLFFADPF